jgi:hypothetical protein
MLYSPKVVGVASSHDKLAASSSCEFSIGEIQGQGIILKFKAFKRLLNQGRILGKDLFKIKRKSAALALLITS